MKVFLTGERGVGKSTVLQKFLQSSGLRTAGFSTYWDGERLLLQIQGREEYAFQIAYRDSSGVHPERAAFDAAGTLLRRSCCLKDEILFMDELGFLEACSPLFQSAVLAQIGQAQHVLGVLRQQENGPFWKILHEQEDTHILTVTCENRDAMPAQLLRLFGQS